VQAERDEQGLLDYVPMGQPPFVVPHTSLWCVSGGETLAALSRLKAGCGHDCPPSNAALCGVMRSGVMWRDVACL
jgi:hypothetical protein